MIQPADSVVNCEMPSIIGSTAVFYSTRLKWTKPWYVLQKEIGHSSRKKTKQDETKAFLKS